METCVQLQVCHLQLQFDQGLPTGNMLAPANLAQKCLLANTMAQINMAVPLTHQQTQQPCENTMQRQQH